MRKILLTVATVVFLYAIAVAAAPQPGQPNAYSVAYLSQARADSQDKSQPQIRAFSGTITKVGDQFVLREDITKASYQLDDQQTASKFDEKKVKVTGTLDASHNIIRVQSIEATA